MSLLFPKLNLNSTRKQRFSFWQQQLPTTGGGRTGSLILLMFIAIFVVVTKHWIWCPVNMSSFMSRLKKETTIQSVTAGHLQPSLDGRLPSGGKPLSGRSLPSEESLPSQSSSSLQIQHRAQVTLERADSRWSLKVEGNLIGDHSPFTIHKKLEDALVEQMLTGADCRWLPVTDADCCWLMHTFPL